MPDLPIPRGRAGAGLIAHVLTAKYCDHQPLHRQAEQYAREDVNLSRSTLADMVGQAARLPDERLRVRLERTAPLLMEMKTWLETTLTRISGRGELAEAIRYALSHWDALTLILRDGRTCIDNPAAQERAQRPIALGRRNLDLRGFRHGWGAGRRDLQP